MPRKQVSDIPTGTWEDINIKCPPASIQTTRQIFKEVNRQMGVRVQGRTNNRAKGWMPTHKINCNIPEEI